MNCTQRIVIDLEPCKDCKTYISKKCRTAMVLVTYLVHDPKQKVALEVEELKNSPDVALTNELQCQVPSCFHLG